MDAEKNPLQQTAEWFQDRIGFLTASRMIKILPGARGQYLKSRADLLDDLVAERITGQLTEGFTTSAMQWGIDTEAEARTEYEVLTGEGVELCGFIRHPSIAWLGASPDGLIGSDGVLEIKCPKTVTHLHYLANGTVPPEYRPQVLTQLLVTGRRWADFVSYDPRLGDEYAKHRIFRVRYTPTEEELKMVEAEAVKFLAEVDEKVKQYLEVLNA